jgi:predicted nucleic acid-binding protein
LAGYLFDTDVLSNLLSKQPSPRLLRRLTQVPPAAQFTSAVTVGEIFYGVCKSGRADDYIGRLEQALWSRVQIVAFDRQVAEAYGRLRADLEHAGRPLPDPDLMIAATGLARSLVLVTGNMKHFARVAGLQVQNWL